MCSVNQLPGVVIFLLLSGILYYIFYRNQLRFLACKSFKFGTGQGAKNKHESRRQLFSFAFSCTSFFSASDFKPLNQFWKSAGATKGCGSPGLRVCKSLAL